ncbi:MAG: hypothetical protein KA715_10580 [Xanthomonadaceae bacterium]|nr:hypothetical protein [Xanthomonadaceae bacterium]
MKLDFLHPKKAIETSKKNVSRQKSLEEKGLSSSRSFELAELEYARYLSEAANASAELARIETRLSRQSQQMVRAPRAGIIHRVLKGRGPRNGKGYRSCHGFSS